jgi:methionyl aminopeptidase
VVTKVKTASEIAAMRTSGKMLASVLVFLKPKVESGVSTKHLAYLAAEELTKLGGISVNDEVVHGIPRQNKIIQDGDIVGLDFGVTFEGMITDAAISVIAGKPITRGQAQLLVDTEDSLQAGIAVVHDQVRTGDIGAAVESSLQHRQYGIVKDLVGHGVGHDVHEDPNIPNYGRPNTGPWLNGGMTIAIEPMVTLGTDKIYIADDGWTVLTMDGSRSAHFEHTVLITDTGAEILTTL